MVELQNISLTLSGKKILDEISFRIPFSKNTIVLGPSGAGKSTILKIILRLLIPDSGKIVFDNKDISKLNKKEILDYRKNIAMVFQSNALFDSMSVADNILYFLPDVKKLTKKEKELKVNELLSFVNLENTGHLFPEELSGGMKKRVAIARALAFKPKLFLFDEPTTGLDPINTKSVLELIEKLKENGTASLIVTHILDDAIKVGDEFIIINNGKMIEQGNIEAILNSEQKFVKEFFENVNYDKSLNLI